MVFKTIKEKLLSRIPSKPRREPLPFDNPTDREIAQVIFEDGEPMLPREIRPKLKERGIEISENAIYRRLWEMEDSGIVEHFRREGFEVKLGRRYFPFVPSVVVAVVWALGILWWNPILLGISALFGGSLLLYWKLE